MKLLKTWTQTGDYKFRKGSCIFFPWRCLRGRVFDRVEGGNGSASRYYHHAYYSFMKVDRWMVQQWAMGIYKWSPTEAEHYVHNCNEAKCLLDMAVARENWWWKAFFQELEYQADLDPDLPSHIWLVVHYLFLEPLNQDITDWANSWNNHKMSIHGQGTKSPAYLRWFSMLEQGARGFIPSNFHPIDETLGEMKF